MHPGISEVRFNYLGNFNDEMDNELFSYCSLESGSDVGLENNMTAKIDINILVLKNELNIMIQYHDNMYPMDMMNEFADLFIEKIHFVIDHLKDNEEVYFTPSDFDLKEVDQEELDTLFN